MKFDLFVGVLKIKKILGQKSTCNKEGSVKGVVVSRGKHAKKNLPARSHKLSTSGHVHSLNHKGIGSCMNEKQLKYFYPEDIACSCIGWH